LGLPIQQHRTFLAKLTRKFPASAPSTRTPITPVEAQTPSLSQQEQTPLQLTNLPYFVRRTPSNQLPVYLVTKAGGTKKLTKIQKTEGDLEALKSDLARALNVDSDASKSKKKPEVTINQLNGHIIVKVCVVKVRRNVVRFVFLIHFSLAGLAERGNPKISYRPKFLKLENENQNNTISHYVRLKGARMCLLSL
jgi:Mitochondrial large subunit ribosomal protein (Img2)